MLPSAHSQRTRQAHISALGLRDARRIAPRGTRATAHVVAYYQAASVGLALETAPEILAEQGIDGAKTGDVISASMLTDEAGSAAMLDKTSDRAAFDRLVLSLIQDASRTAAICDIATRPPVTGYVREVGGACCARCAVLAGRVYRYSTGFQRHPGCRCSMTPTTLSAGGSLTLDATAAFRAGQVRGLSKADAQAIDMGADISQVVNVRRAQAGLTVGSSVIERAGRLTPQGILRLVEDRDRQTVLLRRYGYIT